MIIALDYDQTYTRDPDLWNKFIELAKLAGHKIICITMRFPHEKIECGWTDYNNDETGVKVYYTNRKAKLIWAKANNVRVDIWIDDKPGWLFDDAPSAV